MEAGERGLALAVERQLAGITDPGAGLDVLSMGLVRNLTVTGGNRVSLTFRPSSPLCPMAFSLAPAIKEAIEGIPEVGTVFIRVENFNRARELEDLLSDGEANESRQGAG